MKLKLGSKTIDLRRARSIKRIGARVCILKFVTGESLTVMCGVEFPDNMSISYPGPPEDLRVLLSIYLTPDKAANSSQFTRLF